jgi:IS30 family transposase
MGAAFGIEVRRRAYALLGQGWSPREVAAELGVSREAVSLWRREVGGVIPERLVDSGRYLSREERYEIARLHESGLGVRAIGRLTSRSAATISRELGRPSRPVGRPGRPVTRTGRYEPEACHQAALGARVRPRATKLSTRPVLAGWVQDRLDERYSPAQVSGRLKVDFADDESMRISHETIYRAIYVRPRGELKRELRAHLRTGWPMRTLTWDRGKEMSRHADFTIATQVQVYFADPHAPWQRGSNESANGLMRQYFPKGRDLSTVTDAELQAAVDQLNARPRARHQFLNPNEVLTAILIQDQSPGVATTA